MQRMVPVLFQIQELLELSKLDFMDFNLCTYMIFWILTTHLAREMARAILHYLCAKQSTETHTPILKSQDSVPW
jgi:hypothetical protein